MLYFYAVPGVPSFYAKVINIPSFPWRKNTTHFHFYPCIYSQFTASRTHSSSEAFQRQTPRTYYTFFDFNVKNPSPCTIFPSYPFFFSVGGRGREVGLKNSHHLTCLLCFLRFLRSMNRIRREHSQVDTVIQLPLKYH